MKFKKDAIEPGMVIHCPKEEDARMLLEHLGYACAVHPWERFKEESCYKIIDSGMDGGHLQLYLREREYFREEKITEFSDLVEPDENLANKANDLANQQANEMSATEVAEENSIETVKPITNKACLELWQREGEEETVHYLFHGSEELLQAYLAENSTDGEKSTEMSAVEVLEWFTGADSHVLAEIFDYRRDVGSILGQFTVSEIIDRITAYEATKKVSKPVEYEWGDVITLHDLEDEVASRFVPLSEDYKDEMKALLKEYAENYGGPVSALYVTHGAGLRVKEES